MNREQFIKFMPKPKNQDVIVYDIDLKNLLDVDVLLEYEKLYPQFVEKKQQYIITKKRIEEYQNNIDNVFLSNPKWSEKDYLEALHNDKKTYSILYSHIKKVESKLQTAIKKAQNMEEKIQIQLAKEEKQINSKKETIDKEIEKNKTDLLMFRNSLSIYEQNLEIANEKIKENQEEFELLVVMENELKIGKCKCKYCGSDVKVVSENSLIYKRIYKNLEINKNQLEKLLKEKEKAELNIAYYKSEISKIKASLNNNIEFKKQDFTFYKKKSLEVLKLEALKDEAMKDIAEAEKWLKINSVANSDKYKKLKSNIEKNELSLNNLKRIREMKEELTVEIGNFNIMKKELKEIISKMDSYKKFLEIYFKIYEQKATEYCGNDFKFKIFKFNEYALENIFDVYYKNVEYSQLDKKLKEEADKILIEKFQIYI